MSAPDLFHLLPTLFGSASVFPGARGDALALWRMHRRTLNQQQQEARAMMEVEKEQRELTASSSPSKPSTSVNNINNNNNIRSPFDGKSGSAAPQPAKSNMLQVRDEQSLLEKQQPILSSHLQMIQSQLGFSQHQLQSLMHHHHNHNAFSFHQHKELAEAGRKQLEQLLQMNLFQQAHLMNTQQDSQGNGNLEQLQLQQQQLMTQLQMKNIDIHRHNGHHLPGRSNKAKPLQNGSHSPPTENHPLFSHGLCRWTGCETSLPSLAEFRTHLSREHVLNDRSTAQTRVQVQIVSQLKIQLKKEEDRLEAMTAHLHPPPPPPPLQPIKQEEDNRAVSSPPRIDSNGDLAFHSLSNAFPGLVLPERHHLLGEDTKPFLPLSLSLGPYHHEGSIGCRGGGHGLDPENEINRNRDFYRTQDVRPPFTYAALIRQAIIESPERQLTLNEIYTWFQNTFAYFRRNAATWKNAVRHNLSLHKCFMRVENVKGAVWTVDEMEYHRRRPQRGAANGTNCKGESRSPPPFSPGGTSPSHYLNESSLPSVQQPFHHHHPMSMEQQANYFRGLGGMPFPMHGNSLHGLALAAAKSSPPHEMEDQEERDGEDSRGPSSPMSSSELERHEVSCSPSAVKPEDDGDLVIDEPPPRMTPPDSPGGEGAAQDLTARGGHEQVFVKGEVVEDLTTVVY